MNLISSWLAALLVFSSPTATAQQLPLDPVLMEQIRALDLAHAEAIFKGDRATLEALLPDDHTVNHPTNRIVQEKSELLRMIDSGVVRYTAFERRPEKFLFYKDMVVVMGDETVVPAPGAPNAGVVLRRRYTNAWMLQDGKWRLAFRHANSGAALSRAGVSDANTVCAAIGTAAPTPAATAVPEQARAESARLVAEATAGTTLPSRQSVTAAIELLEEATRIDPGNAVAFARLSAAHGDSRRYADVPPPVAAARRWQAATRAYALDPGNVIVLYILANSVVGQVRDLDCAERILLHARQIAPRDPDVNFGLSNLRGSRGDFKTAFADLELAIANADPAKRLQLQYNSGRLYLMARQYQRVLDHYAALVAANPGNPRNWLAYFYRGLAYSVMGNHDQALVEVSKMPPGRDGDAGALANFARIQVLAGERAAGEANLQLLLARDARGEHVVSYQIAAVYEALGDRDQAFRWLRRYTGESDGLGSWLLWLQHDPRWDRLRDDPRYADVVAMARPRR